MAAHIPCLCPNTYEDGETKPSPVEEVVLTQYVPSQLDSKKTASRLLAIAMYFGGDVFEYLALYMLQDLMGRITVKHGYSVSETRRAKAVVTEVSNLLLLDPRKKRVEP